MTGHELSLADALEGEDVEVSHALLHCGRSV
jgi:hypothetical protein